MTEIAFVQNLLESQWQESITDRSNDVPKPTFVREKEERDGRIRNKDIGYVASGGDTEYTPQGFSWTHERVDTVVVIEYRVTTRSVDVGVENGYDRLYGKRTGPDGLGEPDRWSGIVGETKRVLQADRSGRAEWDLIGDDLRVDDTRLGGQNYWRADVYVPLRNHASSIDTST